MSKSQKFIGRNRPPRVQIEYDVTTNGATKKYEIPFVMGVMSDLSGHRDPEAPLAAPEARKFTKVDNETFDKFMAAQKARLAFRADNKLAEGGNQLNVEMRFNSMEDFSPARVAEQVPELKKLLEARTQLNNLLKHLDGRGGAEALIEKLLKDPALLKTLADNAPQVEGQAEAGKKE